MNNDAILSQAEIDDLYAAWRSGALDPEKDQSRSSGNATSLDIFGGAASKALAPNLDLVYDSFIRYFRITLSNRMRRMIEVHKLGARTYKFDDFVLTLPQPSCMTIYKCDPLKGASMFAIDSSFFYMIVDTCMGGDGNCGPIEKGRVFTNIELKMVQRVVQDVLKDLERAWSPLVPAKLSIVRVEMNPRLVNIVPPEYQVVTMAMSVESDTAKGNIVFAMPLMAIEPLRDKLRSGSQFDMASIDPKWVFRLTGNVADAPIEMSAIMGTTTISMEKLLGLKAGDVLTLDNDATADMTVLVHGVPKYKAKAGVSKGSKAIQITGAVREALELAGQQKEQNNG